MRDSISDFHASLFYSYCHRDAQFRDAMERSLALLRNKKLLSDWSDQNILPGQSISTEIKEKMNEADIIVFLFSPDFISSGACMKEWEFAKRLMEQGKPIVRIPIILRQCPWRDVLANDDIKALPQDGQAITVFTDMDKAWSQVYEGIKIVIEQLRRTFTPKTKFIKEFERTDFLSQHNINLQDIFIFLTLSCYLPEKEDGSVQREQVENPEQLLKKKYALIHGEEMSGKTALGRSLFLSLTSQNPPTPVLHIDLQAIQKSPGEQIFKDAYQQQFNGDYSLWKNKSNKILILDNLSQKSSHLDIVIDAKELFDKIIITVASDIFMSFFKDEGRLADFQELMIESLSHKQQEELIRKRLNLSDSNEPVTDGRVDQIENRINSIITSNKIVPRYPFFVLSILQTYEGFMPENLSITSYGHCYYALILAQLIKSGISRSDTDINSCFNLAEHLASKIYQNGATNYEEFIEGYKKDFVINGAILSRLKDSQYGIISENGQFRAPYMYYFFLGRFFSKNSKKHETIIADMCKNTYVTENYLTLLFTIHHTNDDQIVDDILLGTMCTLDKVEPAQLTREETRRFENLMKSLPENVLSNNPVETERGRERDERDLADHQSDLEQESGRQIEEENLANEIYRILKNNAILGQILRNKYGNMRKQRIEEVIQTIADGGLRLVNSVLADENEIADIVRYIHTKYPGDDINKIKFFFRALSFCWTMNNIEKIVDAINLPEIQDEISNVVIQNSSPAYDLIGYFSQLDSAEKLTKKEKGNLKKLLKKHDDFFVKRVLSIRTQHYMNTHRSGATIEQAICSLLGIQYSYKRLHKKSSETGNVVTL